MALVFNPFTGNFDNVMASSSDMSFSGGSLNVNGDLTLDSGGTFTTTVQAVTPTANRTISFPDQTGTVGLVSGATGNIQYNNAGQLAGTGDLNTELDWVSPTGTYTGLKVNIDDGAGGAPLGSGNLLDLQVNGTTKFKVNLNGFSYGNTSSQELLFDGNYLKLTRNTSIQPSFLISAASDYVFKLSSPATLGWTSGGADLAFDVAFKRDSAGVLAVTDGSTGTGYLKQTPVPFANLAAMPNAAYDGARVMISDGPASPTFGGTASGGGTRTLPVFSDGTAWYFG